MDIDLRSRKFMQALQNGAEWQAGSVMDSFWRWAYEDLANAADRIDAMLARSTVHPGLLSGSGMCEGVVPKVAADR